jgi:hypothetical protein
MNNMRVRVLDYGEVGCFIVLVAQTGHPGGRAVVVKRDALLDGLPKTVQARLVAARADKDIRDRIGLAPRTLTLYANPLNDVQPPWEYDYDCVAHPAVVEVTSLAGVRGKYRYRGSVALGGTQLPVEGDLEGPLTADVLESVAARIEEQLGVRVGPLVFQGGMFQ